MQFDCYAGEPPTKFAYRCQLEADSLDLAMMKFARQEKFRPTHLRVRPLCRIGFKQGVRWFLVVYEHGKEPKIFRRRP